MKTRRVSLLILIGGASLLLAALWIANPMQTVSAQCTRDSSCKTCHETQAVLPVNTSGEWHIQHATADYCIACHGGDRTAPSAAAAHVGVTTDLAAMQPNCAICHTDDCASHIQSYAALIGASLNPSASIPHPSGQTQDGLSGFLGEQPAEVEAPAETAPPSSAAAAATAAPQVNRAGNWILIGMIGLVSLGGGSYVYWNERRLRRGNAAPQTAPVSTSDMRVAELLSRLDPSAVEALEALLDEPDLAAKLLNRLIDLDDDTLKRLSKTSPEGLKKKLQGS